MLINNFQTHSRGMGAEDGVSKPIDPALYDCQQLFPSDLSKYYASGLSAVSPETRRWLRISAVTTSVVGSFSRIFLRSKYSVLHYAITQLAFKFDLNASQRFVDAEAARMWQARDVRIKG